MSSISVQSQVSFHVHHQVTPSSVQPNRNLVDQPHRGQADGRGQREAEQAGVSFPCSMAIRATSTAANTNQNRIHFMPHLELAVVGQFEREKTPRLPTSVMISTGLMAMTT